MANILQEQITPVKPKVLQNERTFVYVPVATFDTKGIATYNRDYFKLNNGVVSLNEQDPTSFVTAFKVSPEDFKAVLGADGHYTVYVKWPYANNKEPIDSKEGFGLIKIAANGGLLFNAMNELEAEIKKTDLNTAISNLEILVRNSIEAHNNSTEAHSDIRQEIADLKNYATTGVHYVGRYPDDTTVLSQLPTNDALTSFVERETGRGIKTGDYVRFEVKKAGLVEVEYAQFVEYSEAEGVHWGKPSETTTYEKATNDTLGLIKGTKNSDRKIRFDIVNGEINDILVGENMDMPLWNILEATYDIANSNTTKINNLENSTVSTINNQTFTTDEKKRARDNINAVSTSQLETEITVLNQKIQNVKDSIKTALVFDSYEQMVSQLNQADKDFAITGQSIYVRTLNVPDLWVYGISNRAIQYNYEDDEEFISSLYNDYTQVGYFLLSQLEIKTRLSYIGEEHLVTCSAENVEDQDPIMMLPNFYSPDIFEYDRQGEYGIHARFQFRIPYSEITDEVLSKGVVIANFLDYKNPFRLVTPYNIDNENNCTLKDLTQCFAYKTIGKIEDYDPDGDYDEIELFVIEFEGFFDQRKKCIIVDMDNLNSDRLTQKFTDINKVISNSIPKQIVLGADGILENNVYNFTVTDVDNLLQYRENNNEFLVDLHLPLVGELTDDAMITITFGDTVYYLHQGLSSTNLSMKDIKSFGEQNETTGYRFLFKAIFSTGDIAGFILLSSSIDTSTFAKQVDLDSTNTQVSINTNDIAATGSLARQRTLVGYASGTGYNTSNINITLISTATWKDHNPAICLYTNTTTGELTLLLGNALGPGTNSNNLYFRVHNANKIYPLGTTISVDGGQTNTPTLQFTSDPQTQIDTLRTQIEQSDVKIDNTSITKNADDELQVSELITNAITTEWEV